MHHILHFFYEVLPIITGYYCTYSYLLQEICFNIVYEFVRNQTCFQKLLE